LQEILRIEIVEWKILADKTPGKAGFPRGIIFVIPQPILYDNSGF